MQIQAQTNKTFSEDLYARAEQYFDEQKLGKYANGIFYAKASMLIITYLAAYFCFVFLATNFSERLFACLFLGICHVFIPVNLSHDAIHNSVSPRSWINRLFLYGF